MAKTLITAQAQNVDNIGSLDFNGFATQDNITQVLVQHRVVRDDRNNGVGNSFTAFGEIIKGDGVNGKIYDIYPGSFEEAGARERTDTRPIHGESIVPNGVSQANVSEIFKYLNAGGSNVKHTRFTCSTIAFYVWKTIYTGNESAYSSQYPGTEYDRRMLDGGINSCCVDIYWGKYVKFSTEHISTYDSLDTKQTQGLYSDIGIFPIDELSGEINLATMIGRMNFLGIGRPPYITFAPINSVYSERQDPNNSAASYFYRSDSEGAVEGYTAPMINLDTRKITGLPIGSRDGSLHGHKLVDHNWTIETDDFATTVTAPTPQDSTTEEVGTKISELPSTITVQDSDLFVISRDDVSQGSGDITYDNSYNLDYNAIYQNILNELKSEFSLKLNLSTVIAWTKGEGSAYIQGQSGFTGNTLPEGTWLLLYFPWLAYDGGGEDDNAWYHGTPIIRQEVAGFDIRSWMVSEGSSTHFGGYHSGSTSPRANYTGHGIGLKVS